MSENKRPSSVLRSIAIILMALAVLFTLMGGIGTTCVAFGAEKYESMKGLVPYKLLYQALVFISIAAGIWGIFIIVNLIRGGVKLYRNAILMLIIGAVTSGIQTAVSQAVRGSSAPVNLRFGITIFTLLVFLVFRLPPLWDRMRFTQSMKKGSSKSAAGTALIVSGFFTLTTYYWTGPTHLTAWIDVIRMPLLVGGCTLAFSGIALLYATHPATIAKKQAIRTSSHTV